MFLPCFRLATNRIVDPIGRRLVLASRPVAKSKGARERATKKTLFESYEPLEGVHDEIFSPSGKARRGIADVVRRLDALGAKELKLRQRLADGAFLRAGITFRVYSDSRGIDKIFPFDLIPRAVSAAPGASSGSPKPAAATSPPMVMTSARC